MRRVPEIRIPKAVPAVLALGVLAAGCTYTKDERGLLPTPQPTPTVEIDKDARADLTSTAGRAVNSRIEAFCRDLRGNVKSRDARIITRKEHLYKKSYAKKSYMVQELGKSGLAVQQLTVPRSTRSCSSHIYVLTFAGDDARTEFIRDKLPEELPPATSVVSLDAPGWGESDYDIFVQKRASDRSMPDIPRSLKGSNLSFGSSGDVIGGDISGHLLTPEESEQVQEILAYTDQVLKMMAA